MKSNKGFTLVELLAIIVILAIIAVITTPVILGVIEDSRKDAAADKAWGAIDAIKLAYAQNESITNATNTDIKANGFTLDGKKDGKTIGVSGEKPTGGSFQVLDDGNVYIQDLTFGDYKCNYQKNGEEDVTATSSAEADFTKIICDK